MILAISLIPFASIAGAAPCSQTRSGPCTPDENETTQEAENAILDLIDDARRLEPVVKKSFADYMAIRDDKSIPASARQATFKVYSDVKLEQDALYDSVINKTAELYHVRPKHKGTFTIGEPTEQDDQYMTGLTAEWSPQVTESGPGVRLALRIEGNDRTHYTGATKLDPKQAGGRYAFTLPDGRVFIMKDTILMAWDKENLGFLAAVLYHETRHHDKLSWTDKTGKNRSWSTDDEEERAAYAAQAKMGPIFGLTADEIAELKGQSQLYENAVNTGVPINNFHLDSTQEEKWRHYYENVQVNLSEEYNKLEKEVSDESTAQQAERNRQLAKLNEERERLKRDEENQRQYYREKMENEAAACGYTFIIRSRETDAVMGIKGLQVSHYFTSDGVLPFNSKDIKIVLLLTRICDAVRGGYEQSECNDSTSAIRERASSGELKIQLDHILGQTSEVLIKTDTRACVDFFISNAAAISDWRSLDKITGKYRKHQAKKEREDDERWHHSTPPKDPENGGGNNRAPTGCIPGDNSRRNCIACGNRGC